MTFLPIIERELGVRARSRTAYWTRFAVALAGMLVCLPQLTLSGPFGTPANMGRELLNAVVSAAFLVSCAACLLTADIISSERREGTLGLVLLTRVRVFDVLVGKLGSAGLTSLCALVALLPMLMIPVLAGGVTGGEAFRKGLVLLDTLFLALAAGLWASARGHEWVKTGRNAVLIMGVIVLGPYGVALGFRFLGGAVDIMIRLSPLGTLSLAGDVMYKVAAAGYWTSLLLVQALGWTLLAGAVVRLRRGWREERGETPVAAPVAAAGKEVEGARASCQPLDDDTNPIAWRLRRQRGLTPILWAGALVGCSHYWVVPLLLRLVTSNAYWSIASPLTLATGMIEGALFAWAASRFFVEARRTGELEMLLTTPLGAQQIVTTQWEILKRALRWPVVVMLGPSLLQAGVFVFVLGHRAGFPSGYAVPLAIGQLFGCVNTIVGVGALCWLGMWFGLRTRGLGGAVAWTLAIGKGVPYLIGILSWLIFIPVVRWPFGQTPVSYWIRAWLPQVVDLLIYLFLIRLVRRRLVGGLAAGEPKGLDVPGAISSAVRDAVSAWRNLRHWTPR